MKTKIPMLALLLAAALPTVLAQEAPAPIRDGGQNQPVRRSRTFGARNAPAEEAVPNNPSSSDLPKFDLDFPGGTPKQLVAAIQKATGKPLNVIIPDDEHAKTTLPALKMKAVNVAQLFQALSMASRKTVPRVTGVHIDSSGRRVPSYNYENQGYVFDTQGPPREDSIWYFKYSGAPTPPGLEDADKEPAVCRFYQLGPYLEQGYRVEDITFAIHSGWQLLSPRLLVEEPTIKYHKDTRLLIAAGDPAMLRLIDDALRQLIIRPAKPGAAPAATKSETKPEPAK